MGIKKRGARYIVSAEMTDRERLPQRHVVLGRSEHDALVIWLEKKKKDRVIRKYSVGVVPSREITYDGLMRALKNDFEQSA